MLDARVLHEPLPSAEFRLLGTLKGNKFLAANWSLRDGDERLRGTPGYSLSIKEARPHDDAIDGRDSYHQASVVVCDVGRTEIELARNPAHGTHVRDVDRAGHARAGTNMRGATNPKGESMVGSAS